MKKKFLVGLVTGLLVFGLIGMANAVVINNLVLPDDADGPFIEILETQEIGQWSSNLSFDIYNYSDIALDRFFVGIDTDAAESIWSFGSSTEQQRLGAEDWEGDFEDTYGAWDTLFTEDGYTYEYVLFGRFDGNFGAWSSQTGDFGFTYSDMSDLASPVVFSWTDENGNVAFITGQTSHFLGQNSITVGTGPAPVPEPATLLLFSTGLVGLIAAKSRKKKK